jgi:spore photoproduct lyase
MLSKLHEELKNEKTKMSFELITHRFTERAKKNILDIFPKTQVPLAKEERMFKYGQFGYGKYLYPKAERQKMKTFFEKKISRLFPNAEILYFV